MLTNTHPWATLSSKVYGHVSYSCLGEGIPIDGILKARTGEVFCDDPIVPDSLTDEPMDAALEWLCPVPMTVPGLF